MKKVGILTFHYSNNYGGVLQSYGLFKTIEKLGYDVEIINYVPESYNPKNYYNGLGFLRRNIFKNKIMDLNPFKIRRIIKKSKKYGPIVTEKFNDFRNDYFKLSKRVNDTTISDLLNDYDAIVCGSDQIWNPSQRNKRTYFLNYDDKYNGLKISYAADSTISEVDQSQRSFLEKSLAAFDNISVRNDHSQDFVKNITNSSPLIVSDPSLLYDYDDVEYKETLKIEEDYILTYSLGEELGKGNKKALNLIKKKYGDLPIYSIIIPTQKFRINNYSDKIFYDLDLAEWLYLFKNAKFVFTDSFHGVLFSLKFKKPFIGYYVETMRSTRFIDLANRYKIDDYIVQSVDEIIEKKSLEKTPNFEEIHTIIDKNNKISYEYLINALKELR